MQPEVTYLWFKTNKNGIFPLQEKIETAKNVKEP